MENKKLKSKVTTFLTMGTNPKDYSVILKVCTHIDHCQICGSALDYSFKLAHKDSTSENVEKDLFVGSDCVENFLEVVDPLKKEQIKRKMKEMIEVTKSSVFLKENPTIKDQVKELKAMVNDLMKHCYSKEINLGPQFSNFYYSEMYKVINKDCNAITRKNYLSKPKTEKFYKFYEFVKSGKLLELIAQSKEVNSLKISDVFDKENDFYAQYVASTGLSVERMKERSAMNRFEKHNFYVRYKTKNKFEVIEGIY